MTSQLGSEIIDYYNAAGRDGMNANGIEIDFALVSIETTPNWDNSINNLSSNNGFSSTFIDATNDRMANIRSGFSYFRGEESTGPPGRLPFAQRRRIVIVNNTDADNPVIIFNDLPLSSGALGTANVDAMKLAIDSVMVSSPGLTYEEWADTLPFPPDLRSPQQDADLDGATNLLEFFSGSDPLDRQSSPSTQLEPTSEGFLFNYHAAKNRVGVLAQIQAGPLHNFSTYTPEASAISTREITPEIDEISISLPESPGPFFRLLVTQP